MNLESSKAGACREPFTTVQVLRRAGHTWKEIAALSGVSVRTVTIGYSPLLSFRKGMSAPQTVTIGVLCRVLYPMPVRDRPSAPRERTVRRSAGLPARTPSAEASPSSGIALSPAQPAGYDVPSPVSGKHRLLLSVPGNHVEPGERIVRVLLFSHMRYPDGLQGSSPGHPGCRR